MAAELRSIPEHDIHSFSSRELSVASHDVFADPQGGLEEMTDASSPQRVTANLTIFIDKLHMRDNALELYCNWKRITRRDTSMAGLLSRQSSHAAVQAEFAFADLFDGHDLSAFKRDYGEEAEGYIKIKNEVEEAHVAYAESVLENIDQITVKDRITAALKVLKEVPGFSDKQKEELLAISGYSADEIVLIAKRLGGSIPIYGVLYAISDATSDIVGAAYGITKPMENNSLADPKTLALTLGSAGVYYAVKYGQALQAEQMLQDDRVKRIPNPSAVIGYYLGQKLFPENERAQKWLTRASYVVNPFELYQERWWLTAPLNPTMFIAGNVVSTAINAAQIGVMEISRRQEIWQANRQEKEGGNIRAEVFEEVGV